MARFAVNGQALEVDADPSTRLLWVLREQIGLTPASASGPWLARERGLEL